MQRIPNKYAGFAAVTLVESLLIHLQEMGILDEGDRDIIYEIATRAHLEAEMQDGNSAHLSVAALLRVLHRRADGVSVVGDLPDEGETDLG